MDRVERLRSEGLAGHGIGRNGQFFDIQDAFYRFTMDSIGEIAFGTSIGCLSHDDVPFAQAFDFAQESVQQRFTNPLWKYVIVADARTFLSNALLPTGWKPCGHTYRLWVASFAVDVPESCGKIYSCWTHLRT